MLGGVREDKKVYVFFVGADLSANRRCCAPLACLSSVRDIRGCSCSSLPTYRVDHSFVEPVSCVNELE